MLTPTQNAIKRAVDLLAAAAGLLLLCAPMLVVALLIRLTSRGPALFRQERVGRHGRLFWVTKFRTMFTDTERFGTVTTSGDSRITPVGRLLRRLKIDELPQLWNVLLGHMSLVGPRPDVPGYADQLTGEARSILDLRPGITGPATLVFRNEEELLARAADPKAYNDQVVFPLKVRLNMEYQETWSLWRDLGYLLVTACPAANRILKVVPSTIPITNPENVFPNPGRP